MKPPTLHFNDSFGLNHVLSTEARVQASAITAVSDRDIVQQMSSVHQWRQINWKLWEADVPIMKEEWSNAGWSVDSIHTLKSGDWYKAEIKYKRTAEDNTINDFHRLALLLASFQVLSEL